MDRLACVDLPAFPLQLLLKEHPDWTERPAAVVAEDKPQAALLWVNEKARRARISSGQRYAAALSLAADLRAGTVSTVKIESAVEALSDLLRRFTPEVEPAQDEPGVFWLNAKGLERLYSSLARWADAVRAALAKAGFEATVVVGFTRFGTYSVSRSSRHGRVFNSREEETRAAGRVALERLSLEPAVRDTLSKLGIQTVGQLLRLPAAELLKRFGVQAHRLHRLAAGDLWAPLQPQPAPEPLRRHADLDAPESDVERLLFLTKRLLDSVLKEVASRGESLDELVLDLRLDGAGRRTERIRPAWPTVDSAQILGLVRLRLESLQLAGGVETLGLRAGATRLDQEQAFLFAEKPRRDLEAASRAFARLRAEFGDQAVVRACLFEGHLPAARFGWEPMEQVILARRSQTGGPRPLVRRIYERPIPMSPRSPGEPERWLLGGLGDGPVQGFVGPYVLSGGWWAGGVQREYYFVKMKPGEVHWVFYDRRRRRWFLEGRVE